LNALDMKTDRYGGYYYYYASRAEGTERIPNPEAPSQDQEPR
jgi:hypothetical protein